MNVTNITISTDALIAVGAVTSSSLIFLLVLVIWYITVDNLFRDNNVSRTSIDYDIYNQIVYFFVLLGAVAYSIINFFVTMLAATFTFVNNNAFLLSGLLLASTGSAIFLQYHDVGVKSYIELRQYTRPFIDMVVYPLLNIIRQLYNLLIGFWNGLYDFSRFLRTGQYRVFLACFLANGFMAQLELFSDFVSALSADALNFLLLGDGIFTSRWDITLSLKALSNFLVSLAPAVICFCRILDFFWIDLASIISLDSLNISLDALWNVLIRMIQIPINCIFTLTLPSIRLLVEETTLFLVSFGDFAEETIYLLLETFFNAISIFLTIPFAVLQLFNARYMRVITQPLSIICILINMTLEACTHLTEIQAPDRSGIAYFQFGQCIDRLKDAAAGFSELFAVMGTSEQCFVRESLYSIITAIAVVTEMLPGALFFLLLPTCCNNPLDFFVDYWFTPGNSLVKFFDQLEFMTQCIGDLLSDLNAPLACSIQNLLNVIIELLRIIAQILIFLLDIITFQPFPTLDDIPLDPLFTKVILWCQCTANIIRQFDPDFCVPQPLDNKQNLICCIGNLLDSLCNIVVSLLRQVINFIFDIITLPTGTIIISQIRIPIFNDAIAFAEDAMCELLCSITSVIPIDLKCQFNNTNITCDRPSGCAANLLCNVTSGLLIPAIVLNTFLIKLRMGEYFTSLFVWVTEPVTLITQWIADIIDQLGAFLDCIVCAALDGGVNCTDDIYQVTHSVAQLLPIIRPFFTSVLWIVIKIFLGLIKGLFVDGDPIGAIIQSIFAFLSQVVGSLGPALVKFVVDLLNRIGLNFLGQIINALWIGLCPTLEVTVNILITVINIISFGLLGIANANFCCGGGNCTLAPSKRSLDDLVQNSTIYLDMNTWIKGFTEKVSQWNVTDPCNISMATYGEMKFNELSQPQIYESIFCVMKMVWTLRTDNQTEISGSKCDALFKNYIDNNIDYKELRIGEQLDIIECIEFRTFMEGIRLKTNLTWIPSDLLTNSWRKYIFAGQLFKGFSIYFQYFTDRTVEPQTLLKPEYIQRWENMGFNTSYLTNLTSVENVTNILSTTTLKDYFDWNNATQYDAVSFLSLKFWDTLGSIIDNFIETTVSLSNTNTTNMLNDVLLSDPSQTSSIITGSLFGLIHELLGALQKITNYWSNPVNLKKSYNAMKRTNEYVQSNIKRLLYWLSTDYIELLNDDEEEDIKGDDYYNGSTEEEIRILKTELKYRRSKLYNKVSTWVYNSIPKIYERKPDQPIDYINILKHKYGVNNDTYIRILLLQTISKFQNWNNDEIATILYKYSDKQFNQLITSYNTKRTVDLPYYYNKNTNSTNNTQLYHTKWERFKYYFNLFYNGTDISRKKWDKIGKITNHFYDIFNNAFYRSYIRIYYAKNEALKFNNKPPLSKYNFSENNENFNIETTNIKYLKVSKNYIVTFRDVDSDTLKKEVLAYFYNENDDISAMEQTNINLTDFNVTIPACSSTVTGLCQNCYYLDQLVGRANNSLHHVIDYYLGGEFEFNVIMAKSFFNYSTDPNRTAIIGGLLNCSVRFPSNKHSNLCYFGDTSIKLRFEDIANYVNNLTLPPSDQSVCGSNANFFVSNIICNIFGKFIDFFEKFFYNLIIDPSAGFDTVLALLQAILLCDWVTWVELTGEGKRFSLGETALIYIVTGIIVSFMLSVIFPSNMGAVFSFVFSVIGIYLLMLYLVLTYGWSLWCGMALPMGLANDLMNATAYIIGPKCEFWLSSLIKEDYNENNCYSYANVKNLTYVNCKNDLKFEWFWDNVVFILQYYYPSALEWLRTAPFPFTLLFNIPYLEQIINKFINVNWDDPIQYSQYMACGLGYTFIPNYVIFNSIVITITAVLSPAVIAAFISIFLQVFFMIVLFIQILLNIITALVYFVAQTTYVQAGLVDPNAAFTPKDNTESAGIEVDENSFVAGNMLVDNNYDDIVNIKKKRKRNKKGILLYLTYCFTYIAIMIRFYFNMCYYTIFRQKKQKKM